MQQALRVVLARAYPPFEPRLQRGFNGLLQSVYDTFCQRHRQLQNHEQPSTDTYFGVSNDTDFSDELQARDRSHFQQERQPQLQFTGTELPSIIETLQDDESHQLNIPSTPAPTSNLDILPDLPRFIADNTTFNWPFLPNLLSGDEVLEPVSYVNSNLPFDLPTIGTEWEPHFSDMQSLISGELPTCDGGSYDLAAETNYRIPSETTAGPPSESTGRIDK